MKKPCLKPCLEYIIRAHTASPGDPANLKPAQAPAGSPWQLPALGVLHHTQVTRGGDELPGSRSLTATRTSHPHLGLTPACQSKHTHAAMTEDLASTQVMLMKTQTQTQTSHATNVFMCWKRKNIIRMTGSAPVLTAKLHLFKDRESSLAEKKSAQKLNAGIRHFPIWATEPITCSQLEFALAVRPYLLN